MVVATLVVVTLVVGTMVVATIDLPRLGAHLRIIMSIRHHLHLREGTHTAITKLGNSDGA